jgi:hypothetical protein
VCVSVDPFGAHLGSVWHKFGTCWAHSGPVFCRCWARDGPMFGPCMRPLQDHMWALLGPLCASNECETDIDRGIVQLVNKIEVQPQVFLVLA